MIITNYFLFLKCLKSKLTTNNLLITFFLLFLNTFDIYIFFFSFEYIFYNSEYKYYI